MDRDIEDGWYAVAENKRAPILPAHIEDTIQAIAQVHLQHHRKATSVQRTVDRMTSLVARPRFVGIMTAAFVVWIGGNLSMQLLGFAPVDPAPFSWLQDAGTLIALYITVLILITQRRENELTEHRQQLTLELAILAEQKTAKIIELLEKLRQDHPDLQNSADAQATEMSKPADPQAVLEAIRETHETGADATAEAGSRNG